jgi:hypothetical protein
MGQPDGIFLDGFHVEYGQTTQSACDKNQNSETSADLDPQLDVFHSPLLVSETAKIRLQGCTTLRVGELGRSWADAKAMMLFLHGFIDQKPEKNETVNSLRTARKQFKSLSGFDILYKNIIL